MATATDEEPKDLLARVCHEWHRQGGNMLKVKELQTFESKTILCLFNVFTSTPKKYVLREFREILTAAQEMAQEMDPSEFFWDPLDLPSNSSIPALELHLINPKLPGQDTSQYNKLSWRAQANRKAYHVECDRRFATDIKRLAQLAKDSNYVSEMWGEHAHISEMVDKDSTPSEIKRLMSVAQNHTNYQCSMILKDIVGITNLDGAADYHQEGMHTTLCFTLRQILLRYVRLSDGHQFIAEVHQSYDVMSRIQAVIPNTPEAEEMILMTNKKIPAYMGNVLRDQGMPNLFLIELFKCSCCPTMILEMGRYTWDSDTGVLTTHRESVDNQVQADLESAAWYEDASKELGLATKEGSKTPAPPPETLFNLDKDRSIKTIHNCNEKQLPSAGSPAPPKKSNPEVIRLTDSDEDPASSSGDDRLRSAATDGDDDAPAPSDGDLG
jgi:hypothetical protein